MASVDYSVSTEVLLERERERKKERDRERERKREIERERERKREIERQRLIYNAYSDFQNSILFGQEKNIYK